MRNEILFGSVGQFRFTPEITWAERDLRIIAGPQFGLFNAREDVAVFFDQHFDFERVDFTRNEILCQKGTEVPVSLVR